MLHQSRLMRVLPALLLAMLPGASIEARPNIVFFLVDDMGWQDTSVPFHTEVTPLNRQYRTPNMERLAGQGMKFTQAYACSVCSPTRVSLMTGLNAARHGVTNWTLRKNRAPDKKHPVIQAAAWNLNGLSPEAGVDRTVHAVTLPMLLRKAGYRTIHVGKAHFGAAGTPGEDPLNLGFDINIGGHAAGGPGSYYGKYNYSAAWRKADRIWDVPGLEAYHGTDTYLTEALTLEANKAVNQAVADARPFYLYMSHYAVHAPWEKDDRFYQSYEQAGLKGLQATYASMLEGMDKSLGDILANLEARGVADDTVVVFMSDNGCPKQLPRNLPLRGHKISAYEGGARVPMIVRWPGMVAPGSVCRDHYLIIEDIFPTFLQIAGVTDCRQIGDKIDGVSFLPLLKGQPPAVAHRPVFWHFPNTYDQPPYSSIRKGDWKLIYWHADRRLELFNLEQDLGEKQDLAETHPDKARELANLLTEFLREAKAPMPSDKETGKAIEYPAERVKGSPDPTLGALPESKAARPKSAIARGLEWVGVAVEEPDYTIWGASPILGKDGKVHLFVARWPEANVDPGWRKSSEIAHYVADRPEGPFAFVDVAVAGTGKDTWDQWSAHNPEIRLYEGKYALLYISNSDYRQPPHPLNQHIGMVTATSLDGPWRRVGKDGEILADAPDPGHWTHGSQVVNPALLEVGGKYLLYFKSRDHRPGRPVHPFYGLAIADRLEGPYVMQSEPLTSGGTIEDGSVFLWKNHVCLLTTDNHGLVTGIRGGGVLWVSRDGGLSFDPELTQVGFDRIPAYYRDYDPKLITRVYGPDPKFERPKVLMIEGQPAYMYAPSGWNVTGGKRTVCHVLRIRTTPESGPLP